MLVRCSDCALKSGKATSCSTPSPAVSVSDEWTRFFALNREHLKRVSVLVGSKVVYLTVAIAQHLSRTGNLIQIYSDPEIFEARLPKRTV